MSKCPPWKRPVLPRWLKKKKKSIIAALKSSSRQAACSHTEVTLLFPRRSHSCAAIYMWCFQKDIASSVLHNGMLMSCFFQWFYSGIQTHRNSFTCFGLTQSLTNLKLFICVLHYADMAHYKYFPCALSSTQLRPFVYTASLRKSHQKNK